MYVYMHSSFSSSQSNPTHFLCRSSRTNSIYSILFSRCRYKFGAEERERERKQNKRKKYLSSTDDWTKTAAKRKKTTTGLGFRSSRNGSAIPLFGASLEISRYAYSRRKDEADIVAVSSRRFARCFAYRVSRVCVHATRTYLFFSPVHRVNGDSS